VDGQWRVIPEMAGAGLWTTPADLARLACALQHAHAGSDEGFLRREVVDQALVPRIAAGYGLGTALNGAGQTLRFGHDGGNIGYRCISTSYAAYGLGAVVMTNGEDGIWVAQELLGAIAEEYAWPGYAPAHTPARVDPRITGSYAGAYELRPGVALTLAERDGVLTLQLPGQEPIELRASSDTAFFSPAVNSTITFERSGDGPATGLTLLQEGQEWHARRLA
jgi:hypothetical protein